MAGLLECVPRNSVSGGGDDEALATVVPGYEVRTASWERFAVAAGASLSPLIESLLSGAEILVAGDKTGILSSIAIHQCRVEAWYLHVL